MAITQSEIERMLTRNTADIEAIYELLVGVQQTLVGHDARFDAHDARFDAHDARFDAHDARFDRIDETLAEVLRRLPG